MWTNCMYFAKIKIPCKPNDYRRLWCPEQKQPNERLCKDMEVGSSFVKIDKCLYISMLQKFNCKNRCHSLSGNIVKNHIGGQSGDKNLDQNLERNHFICSFVYR